LRLIEIVIRSPSALKQVTNPTDGV
jgi:hypothetical protein